MDRNSTSARCRAGRAPRRVVRLGVMIESGQDRRHLPPFDGRRQLEAHASAALAGRPVGDARHGPWAAPAESRGGRRNVALIFRVAPEPDNGRSLHSTRRRTLPCEPLLRPGAAIGSTPSTRGPGGRARHCPARGTSPQRPRLRALVQRAAAVRCRTRVTTYAVAPWLGGRRPETGFSCAPRCSNADAAWPSMPNSLRLDRWGKQPGRYGPWTGRNVRAAVAQSAANPHSAEVPLMGVLRLSPRSAGEAESSCKTRDTRSFSRGMRSQ